MADVCTCQIKWEYIYRMLLPLSPEIRAHIDERAAPLYKLSWKYDESKFSKGCSLDYLLQAIK